MPRKPYSNPYFGDPLDPAQSPVIDPATAYSADPEIHFDNLRPEADRAPTAEEKNDQEKKTLLEKIRQARAEAAASAAAASNQEAPAEKTPCPLCAEAEKARLMALAELENARKRLAREKEEFVKFAAESVIADILPALDNLDLALAYAPENPECRNFVVGVDMTRKLLLDALSRHGLEQVGQLGEAFDPARHEAVEMQPAPDYAAGQVCGLMTKGYRLKDRLIRPARVIVCE